MWCWWTEWTSLTAGWTNVPTEQENFCRTGKGTFPSGFSMFLWLCMHVNDYYYLGLHSVLVLPWIPSCFSLSDWHWVLHCACWILSQVFLSSKWHRALTASFARGVFFSLKSLHSMTQGRERQLLFIPTLQRSEARLYRIHSKAGNWTQISQIPREYLMCTTTLLILRAGQAVVNHW